MKRHYIRLESKRLLLRNIIPEDLEFVMRLWTDPGITLHMGGPRNEEKLRPAIEENITEPCAEEFDLWILAQKNDDVPVGHCGLLKKEVEGVEEAEVVYVIDGPFQGRGYAAEAAELLADFAFRRMELESVIALIEPENAASAAVALKCGFSLEKEVIRPGNRKMLLYRLRPVMH